MRSAVGAVASAPPRAARPNTLLGRTVPGLLLAGIVALTAHVASRLLFPYALAVGFEVPMAMLLGLILVNLGGPVEWAVPGIRFTARYVLGAGIILLGLRLDLQSISQIGSKAFWLVLLTIGTGCTFAILAGRRLGVQGRVAMLIGVGCSICGNSAILATAPVVKADDREVSFAVATITVVGTIAVFVLPVIGHALGLDVLAYGVWTGASVPDTAQTIASSAAYSTVARDTATIVKLVRTAMLAPLLLSIAWGWARSRDKTAFSAAAARRNARKAFPFFLVGFVILAIARSERLIAPQRLADVDLVTRACFVVALAALGLQTRLAHIRVLGVRPFLLGVGTTTLIAVGSLPLIVAFGIGPARTHVAGAIDPRPLGVWSPLCHKGAPPAFAGGFVGLAQRMPRTVGAPVACAQQDGAGNTIQQTSRGTLTLSGASGQATFAAGGRTWPAPAASAAATPPAPLPRTAQSVRLTGKVVASGIPGAGAVSPVGTFHPGSPIHDDLGFAHATRPGAVLDPARLLVASTSNFGEPIARPGWRTGAILSLATRARTPLAVPPRFAASGGQATALNGAVQLYTAQAPSFLNRLSTPGAATADMPAVADPLGISVNNAFGRPWFAGSPLGPGAGIESVTDPDGRPLANAPSDTAGGVFAAALTDRRRQREPGALRSGTVGNALLGTSPDASGRAVFAVATADGALEQVHVEDGVDGLAPAGTIAPLAQRAARGAADSPTRVGMLFNWVPDRFLYVSDPVNDAIVKLHLDDDFHIFHVVDSRRLRSRCFAEPIDLAPAVPEVANPGFSSNTTLAGGADMYVANRGTGTIVRLRQDGLVKAIAHIYIPGFGVVGGGLLNGIAVSPDARTIWVSLSSSRPGAPLSGSLVALPAFGAPA